ncbi:MAG: DUF5615 family PIN-like protein [bacterium]
MKILLDECTPRVVKKRLAHFFIRTVQDMGWAGIKNGQLLNMAEGQFDVLVSTDQSLPYQKNLKSKRLMVIILPSNQVPVVSQLIPALEQALQTMQPGTFVEIPLP